MLKAAASWPRASLSSIHLHRSKTAVAEDPMHQMFSHDHVANELQMLNTNAKTHKARPATDILSSEQAFKLLDRWPDLYVCTYQSHACYICMWTVSESDCMSKAGRLQVLHRMKRQQNVPHGSA